jgi:hypothetical protein
MHEGMFTPGIRMQMHVCHQISVHMVDCVYACICMHVYIYTRIHTPAYIYTHIYIYIYIYTHTHMHTDTYYIYISTFTYAQTHIQSCASSAHPPCLVKACMQAHSNAGTCFRKRPQTAPAPRKQRAPTAGGQSCSTREGHEGCMCA